MNASPNLHARSLRFAEEQVELCRFNSLAAHIARDQARTAAEVHEANVAIRGAHDRYRHAIGKRAFEIRQIA